jgi:hypothetical protein
MAPGRGSVPGGLREARKASDQEACGCLVAYVNHKRVLLGIGKLT